MGHLHFHALAENPRMVQALMGQARGVFRPFQHFLKQAVKTAEQRQTKYHLPWQPVREKFQIQPEALDTVLRVARPSVGWLVEGWPEGKEPDESRPLTNLNTDEKIHIARLVEAAGGYVIHFSGAVSPGDEFLWCRETIRLRQQEAGPKPRELRTIAGAELRMMGKVEALGDTHWRLVVDGIHKLDALVADGNELDCLVLSEEVRSLSSSDGRSIDAAGTWPIGVDELPGQEILTADNGVRYRWSQKGASSRQAGLWIELLPPTKDEGDELLDPRAMFCEDQVEEVWTGPKRFDSQAIKVKRVDRERYRLAVEEPPPEGSELYLPLDVGNLHLQRRAIRQLAEEPLPHHRGLLRLAEDPQRVRWPPPVSDEISNWYFLKDDSRDGTKEQREFVQKALSTPDFAFLEGPPGSGKTTAICEIISQLIDQGKRILLCASTHVAIDNVIERMVEDIKAPVYPVRIGKVDRVDEAVRQCQIDHRIEAMKESLRKSPDFVGLADSELEECAGRLVLMSANLTCGTTMGIVRHPVFKGQGSEMKAWERPITKMPHWDVLIVDEASKTLVQEFMVPALMAKKWIIVGDVKQLPPFADRGDLVANLRNLIDDKEQPIFTEAHQQACLLLFRLTRKEVANSGAKWLLVAPSAVLDKLELEVGALDEAQAKLPMLARFVHTPRAGRPGDVAFDAVKTHATELLRLWAADWILVPSDFWQQAACVLPPGFLVAIAPERGEQSLPFSHPFRFRHEWSKHDLGRLKRVYRERNDEIPDHEKAQSHESRWFAEHDWAGEIAWRLTRKHELRRSSKSYETNRLAEELGRLCPGTVDISGPILEIFDIGLPSVLETIQDGIGEERSDRASALTQGMSLGQDEAFQSRFTGLSYQHRMHPQISGLPRELFYNNDSLKDANTIESRDARGNWSWEPYPARRVWAHVEGTEFRGENPDEVRYIESQLKEFLKWAKDAGRPNERIGGLWEVACLTFYVKQERAISNMLQRLSGERRTTRFTMPQSHAEIVCGTVDRFQGREADLVFLSLRNTKRVGFMDSPNRLNVAITRARQQLVIVGNRDYFANCHTPELEELATHSNRIDTSIKGGKRK